MNKILYRFEGKEKELVDVTEEKDGGTFTRKEEKEVSVHYVITYPTRKEREQADNIYAVRFSECVKMGIVTLDTLNKHCSDGGGLWSKAEEERRENILLEVNELRNELIALEIPDAKKQKKNKKNKEDEAEKTQTKEDIHKAIMDKLQEMQNLENRKNQIYNETAEIKARDRSIAWLITHLFYIEEEGGELTPFFGDGDFEARLDKHDELSLGGTDAEKIALRKSSTAISLWYAGQAKEQKDFEEIEKLMPF